MANVNGVEINLMPTKGMRAEAERYRAWKKEGEGGHCLHGRAAAAGAEARVRAPWNGL